MIKAFFCDLDGTLLFSKRKKPKHSVCVEYFKGEPHSFMAKDAIQALQMLLAQGVVFVPTTTRSIAQYQRIHWPKEILPRKAIVSNGANLLVDGNVSDVWNQYVMDIQQIQAYLPELQRLALRCQKHPAVKSARVLDQAFLCIHLTTAILRDNLLSYLRQDTQLSVLGSGNKIYVLPPELKKGTAARLVLFGMSRRSEDHVMAAMGDSELDASMLLEADAAFCPKSLPVFGAHIKKAPEGMNLSLWGLHNVQRFFQKYR